MEPIAVENGYRESAESWPSVLRDLKRRGLRAPVLAIGDGALGLWRAVRDVWPETREQRCRVHRLKNVLQKLPKRLQAKAKRALHEIMCADCREDAEAEIDRFVEEYGAKHPKAVESLTRDQDCPLSFFDFPAEHWQHLRTTNAVESTFATLRPRQARDQGRRLTDEGPADGLRAARHGTEAVATGHRTAPRRPGQRRSTIQRRNSGQERCLINSSIHNFRQYL